jgi:hypothetical protein
MVSRAPFYIISAQVDPEVGPPPSIRTSDIPYSEADVLVLNRLDVEA